MAEVAGEHGLCSYTVELHIWDPLGLYIWNPALYRFSRIHRVRAWHRTLRHVWLPRGRRSSTGSTVRTLWSSFSKPTRSRGPSVFLPVWGENTGGYRLHTKAIESSERVGGHPACSSQISASGAPRASTQEDATLLVEWALNLNGQGTPCAW